MPEYFRIGPAIWNRPRTDDQRLMTFYMLTNRHRNTEGLYFLPHSYVAEDTGWDLERCREAINDLEAEDFLNYDHQSRVVLVTGALFWQSPENDRQAKAAVNRLLAVPETFLRGRFLQLCERHSSRLTTHLREAVPEWFIQSVPANLKARIAPVVDDAQEAS